MLKEGINASDIKVVSFGEDEARKVANQVNNWLNTNRYNTVYDISFQPGLIYIVYKQGGEPSNEAPKVQRLD